MSSVWSTEASSNADATVSWNPVKSGTAMTSATNKVADVQSSLEPTQFPLGFIFCCFHVNIYSPPLQLGSTQHLCRTLFSHLFMCFLHFLTITLILNVLHLILSTNMKLILRYLYIQK